MSIDFAESPTNRTQVKPSQLSLGSSHHKIKKSNLKVLFEILMIDSSKRSLKDTKQLKEILSDVESLKKLQRKSEFDYICRELTLLKLRNSEFVFQKDRGKLYIVLQGSIGIYSRDNSDATLDVVQTLSTSDCFGQLVDMSGPYASSNENMIALSLEDSILAVLTSEAYKHFQQMENTELSCIQKTLKEFKPFSRLTEEQLANLCKKSTLTKVTSSTVVIREGQLPKAIFIVRKGILKMCRTVKFAECNEAGTHTNAFSYHTKTFCVKELTTGGYFPVSNIGTKQPIPYTIVSVCPCEFVLIPYKQVEEYIHLLQADEQEPTDNDIRVQYTLNNQWTRFKSRFVDGLYSGIGGRKDASRQTVKNIKK